MGELKKLQLNKAEYINIDNVCIPIHCTNKCKH